MRGLRWGRCSAKRASAKPLLCASGVGARRVRSCLVLLLLSTLYSLLSTLYSLSLSLSLFLSVCVYVCVRCGCGEVEGVWSSGWFGGFGM